MSDGVGKPSFRPHQRFTEANREEKGAEGKSDRILRDVFSMTHQSSEEAEQVRFKGNDSVADQARFDRVRQSGRELGVAGKTYQLSEKLAREMVLLEPNQRVISAIEGCISSSEALLLSASPGSGAAFTARWFMAATGQRFEFERLARSTTLESLVGALRPEEERELRVKDGPLARCIRNGGVMIIDGVERADPQVKAALKALANGLKEFHHPVSGEVIKVDRNFRLVLIGDQRERQLANMLGVKTVREIRAYDEKEHQRLATEKLGLPGELSATLARFQIKLKERVAESDLDFGRGFPLGWELLERAGRRLTKEGHRDPGDVARALVGVYGARLDRAPQVESFDELLKDLKLWPVKERAPRKSSDPTFVHTPRVDRVLMLAEEALAAGEVVTLRAHGQSGATRLVEELGRRRKQEVITILGHSGLDTQALIDTPTFDDDGRLYFKPGRITQALLEGKILYVDHLDHLPREQQNAIFQLQRQTTLRVLVGDKIVEKPIHRNARIVLSTTVGQVRGRTPPEPRDRASATEIYVEPPALEELEHYLAPHIDSALVAKLMETVHALDAEQSVGALHRLQRFLDFGNTAHLLTQNGFGIDAAVARAARLVYAPKKTEVLKKLERGAARESESTPLWRKLLKLTAKDVEKALAASGFRITESMNAHLDALSIAFRLGRPVRAIGPASSGKTVLGTVFAALLEKTVVRHNFSQATEGRDTLGGMGPVNEKGKTVFRHVEGPAMRAAELKAVLIADEWNLSRQGQMALKSALDYRAKLIDPENDLERAFDQSFFYAAQNPNDPALGRYEPPPEVADCMFTIAMGSRPVEEKIEVVLSQCALDHAYVKPLANLFSDVEMLVQEGSLNSAVAPVTSTERDILKAARTAIHLIERDGVKDPDEKRRLVGREVFRLIRDQLSDADERKLVLDLVRRHLGKDVQPPPRATGAEKIEVMVDGKKVEMLQIGVARFPLRVLDDAKLQGLVPKEDGLRTPVGVQYEFLEAVLLGAEMGEPVAALGTTGTGKTMLMKWLARGLNQPVLEQPFHADMTEEHLFGAQVVRRDGVVEFQYGDLPTCIKEGIWYIGDEPTTLKNSVRESLNPVTERSEIQIAQKRPPERIPAKDWHPDFRYFETTNGDDVRQDGYSPPEASRRRIIALPELASLDEYLEVGKRDYVAKDLPEVPVLKRNTENRQKIAQQLEALVDKRTRFGKALAEALAQSLGDAPASPIEIEAEDVPELKLTKQQVITLIQAFDAFSFEKKDAALTGLIDELLASSTGDAIAIAAAQLEAANRSPRLQERMMRVAVAGKRLTNAGEVERATNLFFAMRQLQKASSDSGPTPLTPRIYSTFLEVLIDLRERRSFEAAAIRAAELILAPALSKSLQSRLIDLVQEHIGKAFGPDAVPEAPEQLATAVRFSDILVPFGRERPWKPSNERFPLTTPRCQNLQAIAESMELGRGRPISVTDDENGEALETLREYGGLTGRPVTVVTLPPNVELEQLLEKLVVAKGKAADSKSGGFEPELQQIAQAIQEEHILVLRGCGNVSSTRLERLNSLGDGRAAIRLPVSGEWLKAPPDFRMVLMRTPDSLERYSAALQNRLITPPLTTQETPATEAAREAKAAELAAVLRERCSISDDAADKLGVFHVYLNHMLREGRFASGRAVGTFLNRDAEAVARRLSWLLDRNEVTDESEALLTEVMSVYGERFSTPIDRERLLKLAQDAFLTASDGVELGAEITPGPQLNRVGPWAVTRDARGSKDALPSVESVLPEGEIFDRVLEKVAAAAQFDEVIHLCGNQFIGDAAVASLSRLTTSPIVEIEGNRELTEAYLFGGVVLNQQTGLFEEHDGLVFKAQREGATLVVKNASVLSPEVLTRLTEIAATGHLQRVKDGKLDSKLRSFRLVLQTVEGDPPLSKELANLCTVIRAPEITEPSDLRTMAEHQLRRIPGTKPLAKALVDFHVFAAKRLEEESQLGRQELRFDSSRLVEATRVLAERVNADGWSVERALADVVTRLYLRPSEGLDLEQGLRARFEKMVGSLDGWLELERVAPIDLVENPEVDALRRDYGKVAGLFSSELFRAAADALEVALDRRNGRPAEAALAALVESNLLPKKVAERGKKLLASVPWGRIDEESAKQLASFSRALLKEAAQEEPFGESVLAFVRGARVWDLEYRLEIVRRYEGMFETLAEIGGALAGARLKDLDAVRERFDSAAAEERLEEARRAVQKAASDYEAAAGPTDPQLTLLFKRMLSTWNLVSTSPIFRAHALPELHELERALVLLEEAYEQRGGEVIALTELSEAVRHASRTLEGIRIAEQSAELRRGIQRSNQSTEQLVSSLKEEVEELRRLAEAKKDFEHLDAVQELIRSVAEEGLFLRFDPSQEKVERPAKRSDAEIQAEAEKRAQHQVAHRRAEMQEALLVEVNGIAASVRAPARGFFNGWDHELDPEPKRPPQSEAERAYHDGKAEIEATCTRELRELTKKLAAELRSQDDKRVEEMFQTRLKQRVQEVGARIQKSATELRSDLQRVVQNLDLHADRQAKRAATEGSGVGSEGFAGAGPADLAADAEHTFEMIDEAIENTRGWMRTTAEAAGKIARGMMRFAVTIASFGFAELPEEQEKARGPSIDDAKRAAADLLGKLHDHVISRKEALPKFELAPTHEKKAEGLVDQLLASERLGELAAKYTKLEAMRETELDPDVKRHLTAVLGQIKQERGMKEMLAQVSLFCEGADLLSADAAKGGVAVELAPAVDAVMRAAEAVRTQSLGAGAYKKTVSALARAVERIEELAAGGLPLTAELEMVRHEMQALSDRIHEMFSGRSELLTIEGGNYREMLRSLGSAEGGQSASESIESAFEPIELLREAAHEPEPNVEALAEVLEEVARAKQDAEAEARPERAARLTVIDVSFDRAAEIEIPSIDPKEEESDEDAAAREALRALQTRILTKAGSLEERSFQRSGELERERERLLTILGRLEDRSAVDALSSWSDAIEDLRAELEKLAASPDGVRGFTRDLRSVLDGLRRASTGLRGLERVPDDAVVKLDSAIEGARALESAFSSDRFLHLARDWAAGALLAVTETAGIVNDHLAEAKAAPIEAGKSPLLQLSELLDRLCESPGRLGGSSRLSMLLHLEQRLIALSSGREGGEVDQLRKMLEQLRTAKSDYEKIGDPLTENAAGDILEATVELGAALVAKKKIEAEQVSRYESLVEQIEAILTPGKEQTPEDRAAISLGIELAEELAESSSPAGERAHEVSRALGHLRSGENTRLLSLERRRVREESASYLGRVRDARLVLDEATKAFVEYSPLNAKGATLQDVARELLLALSDASTAMTGPAAVVLAETLLGLAEQLEKIVEREGPAAAEGRRLLEELDPLLRRARVVGETKDAPVRFSALVQEFETRTDRTHAPTDELAGWTEKAAQALIELMAAGDDVMAEMLEKVEQEHFPELLREEEPVRPEPTVEEEVPVARPVSGLARMLANRAGAGDRMRSLRDRVESPAPAGSTRMKGTQRDLDPIEAENPTQDQTLGPIHKNALSEGEVSSRSDKAELVELSKGGVSAIRKRMQKSTAEVDEPRGAKEAILTEFEEFIVANEKLVEEMAGTLRQFPGLETVLVLDQSDSTKKKYGDSKIIDQERAAMALIIAAHMRAERNVSVVGFGGHVGDTDPVLTVDGGVSGAIEISKPEGWDHAPAIDVIWERIDETTTWGTSKSVAGDPILKNVGGTNVYEKIDSRGRPRYFRQDAERLVFQADVNIYVHKPMAERLTHEWADYAFKMAKRADGWTDFIGPGEVALGQFTERANKKLILYLTDADLHGTKEVKRWIGDVRGQGVGFAMLGFGDATHVKAVAEDFGEHVTSYADAIHKTKELFLRTVIANAKQFRGTVKGGAEGVGTPEGQAPMQAAPSDGPMDQALLLSDPTNIQGDPPEVFATQGRKRDLTNLVDRGRYERAVKELDRRHLAVSKSTSYKRCLKEIRLLRARHEREGTIEALAGAIMPTLPKTRGVEWERKQLSGSSFDEQQLLLYVAGLAQGVPVQRIFKRRKSSEETKATVVLMLDESSSMGDSEKMRANLEALLAYGDALKAADSEIKIAVVGYGDKVRLHAGFEQDWNEEVKAHILHQVKGTYDATDDERAAAEGVGLLRLMDAEVGMVLNFSDGQGMPGMESVMKSANEEGFAFLTVGVGADCVSVSRFGAYGLYARNLGQLVQRMGQRLFRSWELAGRLT